MLPVLLPVVERGHADVTGEGDDRRVNGRFVLLLKSSGNEGFRTVVALVWFDTCV